MSHIIIIIPAYICGACQEDATEIGGHLRTVALSATHFDLFIGDACFAINIIFRLNYI